MSPTLEASAARCRTRAGSVLRGAVYDRGMASWHTFALTVPQFAATVRERLESGPYALLGSIRADGHPRISGVIVTFSDEELWIGMPASSLKTADLARQPKMSLHSAVSASPTEQGDVKLSGTAVPVGGGADGFRRFAEAAGRDVDPATTAVYRIVPQDASQVRLSESGDHHVIESWRSGQQGTLVRPGLP